MKIIGIDIGTTTISGVVLENKVEGQITTKAEEKLAIVEAKTIENGCFIPTEHEWERIQDAEQIVKKAQNLTDYFLDKYQDVERIGLTGQMHGIVYIDKNGKCVSPLYTWQDERGNLYSENGDSCGEKENAYDEIGEEKINEVKIKKTKGISLIEEIQQKCKLKTASGYGLVTHIYNMRHSLIPKSATSFCTIMDYLGMCLTGRQVPLVHVSNAASFGFFNGRKMCFETEKLNEMGIEEKWLPEICTDVKKLGTYRNCTVTAAIGDNQASFLGSVGNKSNTLLVNMGTGGQISILSDWYFEKDGIEARPFLNGKYLLAGASLCGGKAYALLENFFRKFVKEATGQDKPLYKIMETMAEKGKEFDARQLENRRLKIETTFDGTRVSPELGGSITNLFSDNFTPESFTYGVLEGMSRELYNMYQTIHNGTDIEVKHITGSGNGLRKNKVLCEIVEEMFGAELVLAEYEEEVAVGAAISGSISNVNTCKNC